MVETAQAVSFLVIHQKQKKTLEEITTDLCPVLSVQQLYRISTMYWDDRYATETVAQASWATPALSLSIFEDTCNLWFCTTFLLLNNLAPGMLLELCVGIGLHVGCAASKVWLSSTRPALPGCSRVCKLWL